MADACSLFSYPPHIQAEPPEQWAARFARLLGHWSPELSAEAAYRTAGDWQRSLGVLGPVEAFAMYRRVASEAERRARLAKVQASSSASPRAELLDRIAAATSQSEIARILVDLIRASGGGPIPAELAAAVLASQLRLVAGDRELAERAREAVAVGSLSSIRSTPL